MLEPFLVGLDRHHRRGRAGQPDGRTHDAEPLVGGRFDVAVQDAPHAIDQNLGATAGQLSDLPRSADR